METESNQAVNKPSLKTSTKFHSKKKWIRMFQALLSFREKNGHCLVPNRYIEDPQLGSWVSTQRRQYKLMKLNNSPPMNAERVKLLESIGFVWATRDPRHVPWDLRFQQLLEYKREHGNCLVPIGHKVNIKLSNWVSTQRQEYKLYLRGKTSRITKDRIQRLNDIGFVWEAHRGTKGRKQKKRINMEASNDRVNPCCEHHSIVKDAISMDVANNMLPSQPQTPVHLQQIFFNLPPNKFNSPQMDAPFDYSILSQLNSKNYNKWMSTKELNKFYPNNVCQALRLDNSNINRRFSHPCDNFHHKAQFRKDSNSNHSPSLVNLQIEPRASLISSCSRHDPHQLNSDHLWNENFEKLRLFYKKNGHSLVPKCYPQDPDLGAWVYNVREEFRSKPNKMTSPKFEALKKLHFVWTYQSKPVIPAKAESSIAVCQEKRECNQELHSDTHFSRQVSPSANNSRHDSTVEKDNSNIFFMSLRNKTNSKIASSIQAAITLCSLCNPMTPVKKTEDLSGARSGVKRFF